MSLKMELLFIGCWTTTLGFDEASIASDGSFYNDLFSPDVFVFTKTKLSWNDARRVCVRDGRNLTGLASLTPTRANNIAIMQKQLWIGLISASDEEPIPTWITCGEFVAGEDGPILQENVNSSFSPTRRCGLYLPDKTWEWRDCGERHGFVCDEKTKDEIPIRYAPVCGKADNSPCPFFNGSCTDGEELTCAVRARKVTIDAKYSVFTKLLSWNDAARACKGSGQGRRLAKIPNQTDLHQLTDGIGIDEYPLWVGLYRSADLVESAWIDCSPVNQSIESENKVGRCTAINDYLQFEWRNCSERLSFVCENGENDFMKEYILERYVPREGYEDNRSIPDPEGSCFKEYIPPPPDESTLFPQGTCIQTTTTHAPSTTPEQITTTDKPNDFLSNTTTATPSESTTNGTTTTTTSGYSTNGTTDPLVTTPEISASPLTDYPTTAEPPKGINNPYCNTSCLCRCKCVKTVYLSPDEWMEAKENKSRWISSILEEISPNQSSFSSNRRRLESAEDTRRSVATIGSLGIAILVVTLVGILLLDLSALVHDFTMLTRSLRHIFRR